MSTERTPLTSSGPTRTTYIYPGVSPRSRQRQMRQFQCCMCTMFLAVLVVAFILTISYAITENTISNITLIDTQTIAPNDPNPEYLNDSNLLNFMLLSIHPKEDESPIMWNLPSPELDDENSAESYGLKCLGDKEILEENIATLSTYTPSFRHQKAITSTTEARKLAKRGYVEYHATFYLAKKFNYTKRGGRSNIGKGPKVVLSDVTKKVMCDFNAKYRTADGSCNNKEEPYRFGIAFAPFRRALQPDYDDGIASPRKSRKGVDLPSARLVSLGIHRAAYAADLNFTVMLAVFGQFLDHDITATALTQGQDGEAIDCCVATAALHPECFPVPILPGDPYFDDYNITCMNFVRSAPAPTGRFGPRQQLNQATAFIDGSVVYGNTERKQQLLRTNEGGELRMYLTSDKRALLPISTNPQDGCNQKEMNGQGKYCFETGDERANENLYLTSMHLLFARHHNYLAQNLRNVNPHWEDEQLFQEARKILGAQMQHIAYNEFLPVLLGHKLAEAQRIKPNPLNRDDTYDPFVNPSIANNFAAAVFRFAHTLLPSLLRMKTNDNNTENIQLHKMLFNPYSLWIKEGVDNAINSAINTPTLKVNQFVSEELTEKLFEVDNIKSIPRNTVCGLDLVSLNIQRGRDHGLPAYFEWRRHCGLPPVESWDDMGKAVDADSLEAMRKIYNDPRDVDLYTGALSEPPLEGAIFGPLLACLITDQFVRIKAGDSHWYERTVGVQRLSEIQRAEIYTTTLASIICQNADNISYIQRNVMLRLDPISNPYVDCSDLVLFNFSLWSEMYSVPNLVRLKSSFDQVLVKTSPKNNSIL